MLWWVAFVATIPACVNGFYLPGVAPTDYVKGEELNPKVFVVVGSIFFHLGHIVNVFVPLTIHRWKH